MSACERSYQVSQKLAGVNLTQTLQIVSGFFIQDDPNTPPTAVSVTYAVLLYVTENIA